MNNAKYSMRDVFIEHLTIKMERDSSIYFVSADFGSPKLDNLRARYKDRFINAGIAEQNVINISTGLALEGNKVFAYAIAPFITMRCYEQIRVNLSIQSQLKKLNVNLIGVGAGLSYDVSGPTHHCLEDISIMRTLPNIDVISPSDCIICKELVDYSLNNNTPKYLRFDGKQVSNLYKSGSSVDLKTGFSELLKGKDVCIISTGFMTHSALLASEILCGTGVSVNLVDIYKLKTFDLLKLAVLIKKFGTIVTIEEGFIGKGGIDSIVLNTVSKNGFNCKCFSLGFNDRFDFRIGDRFYQHSNNGLSPRQIAEYIAKILNN